MRGGSGAQCGVRAGGGVGVWGTKSKKQERKTKKVTSGGRNFPTFKMTFIIALISRIAPIAMEAAAGEWRWLLGLVAVDRGAALKGRAVVL